MSRVDEARRRAAEIAAQGAVEQPMPPIGLEGADASALADEPFPIEMTERRRHRPTPAASGTAAAAPALLTPHEPPPVETPSASTKPGTKAEPRSEKPRSEALFERMDEKLAEKVVIDRNIMPTSREQYRRLAAILHDAQGSSGLRVIMVGSAVAGEGKTLTAANLALTFSESYRKRVLLIDADLRKPALDGVFRINSASGLTDGLASENAQLTVRQVSDRLSVLPAGRPSADPMEGLVSDRMRRLIDEARGIFDWIILDTPPLVLLPDAHLLASMVEGVIMVIKAESTPHYLVKRAVDAIGKERVLGVVLNRAHAASVTDEYNRDYYTAQSQALEEV